MKKLTELPEVLIFVGKLQGLKSSRSFLVLPDFVRTYVESSLKKRKQEWKAGQSRLVTGCRKNEPDVLIQALPEDLSMLSLLEMSRNILKRMLDWSTKSVGLVFLDTSMGQKLSEAFGAATACRIFKMPLYGKKANEYKNFLLQEVYVFSQKNEQKSWQYGFEMGEGSNLVRSLGTQPSNLLSSGAYGAEVRRLCKKYSLRLKFYSNAELKKMGAGAFTAVDQGDPHSRGGIYEITYQPTRAKNKKPIALVGKGICFDTGGYDVKTSGYMVTMKGDMQGSAVALSSLLTAARLKLPIRLKAYLGVTENHISPKAYKPDDVVMALNGDSIEIVNTDAEGRMVLADTLCLASRAKPELIMDFATLTGAAVYSIGTRYSAGFTNQGAWHSKMIEAGRESGERVWTFPLDKDFGKALESPVADTLQCGRGRGCDHIHAAFFLNRFVGNSIRWVHIDLSAAENKGGLGATDTEFTGFGVRWTISFLKKLYKV